MNKIRLVWLAVLANGIAMLGAIADQIWTARFWTSFYSQDTRLLLAILMAILVDAYLIVLFFADKKSKGEGVER